MAEEEERGGNFYEVSRGFLHSVSFLVLLLEIVVTVIGFLIQFGFPIVNGFQIWPLGFILAMGGMVATLVTFIRVLWRSRYYTEKRNQSYSVYREALVPALCGGLAYLLLSLVQESILPVPGELQSQTLMANVENAIGLFLAGSFVAMCVCYYSIKYSSKIAPNNPFLRTLIYSAFAFFVLTVIFLVLPHSNGTVGYLIFSVAVGAPRYLVLGAVAGLVLSKTGL